MIYVLIANNKIKLMSSSQAKINYKICELKKKDPNTKINEEVSDDTDCSCDE